MSRTPQVQLARARTATGHVTALVTDSATAYLTATPLAEILHHPSPAAFAASLIGPGEAVNAAQLQYLAPLESQEVWAAGVTYKRSKVAREEESAGAAQFYDAVYTAPRPELFLKATPGRVRGHLEPIRVRVDSKWSVPEPELVLVVSPAGRLVGYTIGNDVSSRDIEGENPLYLPQAKIYKGSCALGPLITLVEDMPDLAGVTIHLEILRERGPAFEGSTSLSNLNRTPESLIEWLLRENEFPHGVYLFTGTGIVPPDEFTLKIGDVVNITIDGIGTLTNVVGA